MSSLTFSLHDAVSIRFAFSPLKEVVAAVGVLRDPAGRSLHLPWVKQVRPRLAGLDLAPLGDLCRGRYIPDFLTPPPATPVPDLALELATLRATPHRVVRADLDRMTCPPAATTAALRDDPAGGLDRLAAAVQEFWDAAFAPYWPRMRDLLEGDVLYRARRLAAGGLDRLFADLHPVVRWTGDRVMVHRSGHGADRTLAGEGLLLIPSVFVWPGMFSRLASPGQPTITYPARGVATLWETGATPSSDALAAVLGRPRALILAELSSPLSTTELARRLPYAPASVSEHLALLRAAGLVIGHRTGRSVLYVRTPAADALLAARPGDR
ncbi:ArsR/SmtB family transcription factor [Sphaerisporangium rufum]|nr:DUF5937 family protein [Sphaerisporangium rufum]